MLIFTFLSTLLKYMVVVALWFWPCVLSTSFTDETPEIIRPDGTATVTHNTVHFIKKTPGQAVAHKRQRLASDKLQAAKEFDAMLKQGDEWRPVVTIEE